MGLIQAEMIHCRPEAVLSLHSPGQGEWDEGGGCTRHTARLLIKIRRGEVSSGPPFQLATIQACSGQHKRAQSKSCLQSWTVRFLCFLLEK